MSVADETGVTMDRYSDLLAQCIALAVEWKGQSVNTSERELLGHLIRNLSLLLAEHNEKLQAVYDGGSVAQSIGVQLDNLLELIGVFRQAAAKSTVTLTCTATVPTTIPAGSIVKTAAEVEFLTDADLVFVGAGSQDVTATCNEFGPFNAAIAEVSVIATTVYGWSAATNASAVIPGRLRELDAALKKRHTTAVSTSGERDAASIYEAVFNVAGVSAVRVDEDYTSETPVSVYVIGGSDAAIAAAIDGQLTIGIGTAGTTSVDVYNSTMAQNKTIKFTRATNIDIYISATLTKNTSLFPADGELQIKNALVAHIGGTDTNGDAVAGDQLIGQDVNYLALSGPILTVPGVIIAALYLDDTASPAATIDLTVDADKLAFLNAANVVISYTS